MDEDEEEGRWQKKETYSMTLLRLCITMWQILLYDISWNTEPMIGTF